MLIVNVPMFIAWFIMYNANSVTEIFVSVTLLGLGAGLMVTQWLFFIENQIPFHLKLHALFY